MAFIDIHGHYAWDIDDGMPSLEDAKKAKEATPSYVDEAAKLAREMASDDTESKGVSLSK